MPCKNLGEVLGPGRCRCKTPKAVNPTVPTSATTHMTCVTKKGGIPLQPGGARPDTSTSSACKKENPNRSHDGRPGEGVRVSWMRTCSVLTSQTVTSAAKRYPRPEETGSAVTRKARLRTADNSR